MNMRWRKVAGDFRLYGLQIGLIALVLVLGTAGVVAALNAQAILKREIAGSYAMAASPDIVLWFDRVEPPLQESIAKEEGVAAVDARRVVFTRIAVKDGTWLPMRLTIVRDFSAQKLGTVHLHAGSWPASDSAILIEQSGETLIDATSGTPLRIRMPNGEIATLPSAGLVHDTAVAPSTQDRMIYAYATPAAAAMLGQNPNLDQLLVKMKQRASAAAAYALGTELSSTLTRYGTPAQRMDVLPAEHPHGPLMTAMLRVLGVLSVIAFACSAALAGYMVSAWMRREVRQVGIMKAIGARSHQIAWQYLALVGPTVVLALVIALPLGMAFGRAIVAYYAVSLNIDVANGDVPQALLLQEIAFALGIPLVAMILPIVRAARMSPHTAIHDTGITALPGASRLASRLIKFPGHLRWTFALRNSWRRPWRLLTMLLALSAGGALLLMTHSNYESLMRVIDVSLSHQGHDIEVLMQRPVPAARLETIARGVRGVEIAEAWRRASVNVAPRDTAIVTPSSGENRRVTLTGYPVDTRLFRLPVVQGRAPRAGSGNEVLVTRTVQEVFPQLQIGSRADLLFRDRRVEVTVVGTVEEIGLPALYTDFATFDAVTALGDASSAVRVMARDGRDIELVTSALDQSFLSAGLAPGQIISRNMVRDALDEHFNVVGDVVRMVALAAALVGAIILAATTSLNVLERAREIGILRAMGATPRRITAIFLAEGASITAVGFLLAVAISIPLTLAVLNAAEHQLLHVAVPLHFSLKGLAILSSGALVVLLTVLLAVSYSLRKPVRETLAYE